MSPPSCLHANAVAVAASLCLISACVHANGRAYLTASEIERLVIGKGLKEASSGEWKQSLVRGDAHATQGSIFGRSRSSIPFTGTWSLDADGLCVDYGDEGGCYRLTMEQGNQVLWFDRAGALTYKSYLVEADRPEDFAEWMGRLVAKQTVTFRHGSDTLVGDLRLPAGPAPYPAIVFVHGAGLPSRHSPYYRPLAEEFFRRGFATLVWSRPGVDESTGDYLDHSMDQRAGEVEAAIRYLGERADIAPTRIGLWATSQAGFVVPKVAARREVAFANLVSCSAQGVIDQTLYATENVLALLGMSEVERDEALDNLRSEYELIRVSGTHEEFLRGQEQLLAEATQRSWYAKLAHSPAAPEAWFLGLELPWYLRFLPRTSASYPPTARAFRSFIRSSGTTLLLESSASEHRCS